MKGHFWRYLLAALLPLPVIALLLLFYQSTQAVDDAKIYNISVFARSPGDRFMKGIEQAALDYNVDLHFFSSYAKNDGAQQIEYLRRELESDIDAVVIAAEDAPALEDFIDAVKPRPPIITLGARLRNDRATAHVGADGRALGELLGRLIIESGAKQCVALCPSELDASRSERLEGLTAALDGGGVEYTVRYAETDINGVSTALNDLGTAGAANMSGDVSQAVAADKNNDFNDAGAACVAIAVIDEGMAAQVCESAPPDAEIYAIGYQNTFRQYLETGRLRQIVVYSEYDAGYLCLQSAVRASDKRVADDADLALHTATADNMYTEPLVNILFPIG